MKMRMPLGFLYINVIPHEQPIAMQVLPVMRTAEAAPRKVGIMDFSVDTWSNHIMPALSESGLRVLVMSKSVSKAWSIPLHSLAAVRVIKAAFPAITNWPDRSSDEDNGEAFYMATARRFFTELAPCGSATTGVVLFSVIRMPPYLISDREQYVNYIRWTLNGNETGKLLMQSNAGRKRILDTIDDLLRDGILFRDLVDWREVVIGIIRDIVRNDWSVRIRDDGTTVIGGCLVEAAN